MNIQQIEKLANQIEVSLFKRSSDLFAGALKSHMKGSGVQFKDHQVYHVGDDVKFIDWNILAKTNNTYVKVFEEERNIEITILLDLSQSMFLGFKGVSKMQMALEICSFFIFLSQKTKDHINVVLLGDEIKVIPKLVGKKGVISFLAELEKINLLNKDSKINLFFPIKESPDYKQRFSFIKPFLKKKKSVIVLSDFSSFLEEKDWNHCYMMPSFYFFQLISPLDKESQIPYSFYSSQGFVNRQKTQLKQLKNNKKLKILEAGPQYIDKFLKYIL